MALIHTLRDDFSTNTLAANWPNAFGTCTITGGRMRVTCDTAFNGAKTATSYTLDGSKVCAQVFPAAAGTATVEATTELLVLTTTAGTDAGISYNAVTGNLTFSSRSGFFDAGATTLTYNATTHRWWQLRVTSGTMFWETSSDGDTWTTRRSATAPAWVSNANLAATLNGHRNNGTNDFAEFDNYNFATIAGVGVVGTTTVTPTATGKRTVKGAAVATLGPLAPAISAIHRTVHGAATTLLRIHPSAVGTSSAIIYPVPDPQARWQILTGPASGGYAQELTVAKGRKLTMRLTSPSDLTFDLPGTHGEAYNIDELLTDAHVRWTSADGDRWLLFRGRVGPSSDSGSVDEHRMSVTALDYRGVLNRRRLWHGTSLNSNDSFEDGTGSWAGSGGTFEVDDGQRQDRTKSGRITPDGVTATVKIASDNFTAAAGNTYRLSGWIRSAVARSVTFQVDWKNGGGGTISSSTITETIAAETWVRFDGDATAPATTTQASVVALMTGTPAATDIMWVDDARLTIAPNHASQLRWASVDQASIAWGLITDTQTRTAGNMAISNGSSATGTTRDRTYSVGDSVGELIQQLSETLDGFDWEIVPDSPSTLLLRIWSPQRGVNRGVVLIPGGLISTWRREVQPSDYGNAERFTGADTTTPQELEADDLATRDEGRWDVVLGDTGLTTQAALNERADWQLVQSQTVRPTYTVTLTQGAWMGPGHIWLGDPVQLVIYSGRLRVNTTLRVYEMGFTLGDDGGEQIELVLGGPRPIDVRQWPAHQDRRISTLERR